MYFVYLLQSRKDKRLYVGYTNDLRVRLRRHNNGNVRSTKGFRPWVLVYYEAYRSKKDATQRERTLKLHTVKSEIKERISNSLQG